MKAAFFDVDGTLTKQRVWSGLMDYFKVNRVRMFRFYMFSWFHYGLYILFKIGLVSQIFFRSTWAKNLSWHFSGFSLQRAEEMWDWVIENRLSDQWRMEIVEILRAHKSNGDVIFLVSGGPEGLLERITKVIGGDYAVGTRHQIRNGYYTGKSEGIACQGENKVLLVKERIRTLGLDIDLEESFAYADSMADLQLLSVVGHPTAVYPDDDLREIALQNEWKILES